MIIFLGGFVVIRFQLMTYNFHAVYKIVLTITISKTVLYIAISKSALIGFFLISRCRVKIRNVNFIQCDPTNKRNEANLNALNWHSE